MTPTRPPTRLNPDAIYRSRSLRAALDEGERDKVQTARDRIGEALAETLSDAVRSKLEAARDRLDEALGTVGAPDPGAFAVLARRLPRTIADVARRHYSKENAQ